MANLLVIAEHRRGELRPVTLELVAAAQSLRAPEDRLMLAVIGRGAAALVPAAGLSGVDEVLLVPAEVDDFDPDISAATVSALIAAHQPALVLLPHSVDSYAYAATLAAREGLGFATDVFRIERDAEGWIATRGGYGQKVAVELDFPGRSCVMLAVRPGVYKPDEAPASPPVSTFPAPSLAPRGKPLRYIEQGGADDVDITTVEFILSVGRGIGDEANLPRFRELAEAVGATLCCSRPIADSGWLPKSRQVGQSGKTASACKLYLALGISGAIQHLAGMKHVETIVAVNTDPQASIFNVAKFGIVGDIFELADALEEEFG
jgi:electron transfer flavoprotein alpha subunit